MHSFGGQVGLQLKAARQQVADLIHARPEEIVFTGCGTESDNTAILSALAGFPEKKHVITSAVEHPAVKNLCEYLEKKGYRITFVPVDAKGRLDLDFLYNAMDDDTALVSIMWANNETGVLFPVADIARKASEKGILFHTDAVQAVGKVPIKRGNMPCGYALHVRS